MTTAKQTVSSPDSVDFVPWARWRTIAIRAWAALLVVDALVMAQGVVMIGSAGADERFVYATSSVWKLISLGGAAVVLWTGGRSVAAYWAIAVGQLTWLVSGLIAPEPGANGPLLELVNIVLFYGPLILLRPRRRELLNPAFRPSRVLLAVALAAAVPMLMLALRAHSQVSGEIGFDMVGLYLVLAVMGVFGALRPAEAAWLAPALGVAAALTGVAALVWPDDLASPGRSVGLLLLAAGVAIASRQSPLRPLRRSRHLS